MPIADVTGLLRAAQRGGYALGYFESWSLESLQGVLDAAEEARCPIVVGFNGEFLTAPQRGAAERLELYAALARAGAQSATVPCGAFFNECTRDEYVHTAITAGYNLVMPALGNSSLAEYTRRVRSICGPAHAHGVAVQAELGELPSGVGRGPSGAPAHEQQTDPDDAARFVEATGVDLLAVSVGNVHILMDGRRGLDLDRLARIRERVSVPLVLHGGTGIDRAALRAAVGLGVALVQFGTGLKLQYLAAVRRALASDERNPHELLGIGGPADVMCAGRRAVRDAVLAEIDTLGCRGRA
jgi:ketose-bisphosphate aldolase